MTYNVFSGMLNHTQSILLASQLESRSPAKLRSKDYRQVFDSRRPTAPVFCVTVL